jgi:hypothetical protein
MPFLQEAECVAVSINRRAAAILSSGQGPIGRISPGQTIRFNFEISRWIDDVPGSAINAGQTLSASTFPANAYGTVTWANPGYQPAVSVLAAGDWFPAIFTPHNLTDYDWTIVEGWDEETVTVSITARTIGDGAFGSVLTRGVTIPVSELRAQGTEVHIRAAATATRPASAVRTIRLPDPAG